MSQEMAEQIIVCLTNDFKPKRFSAKGMQLVWDKLIALPDKALEEACNHFCLKNYFPSPEQLLERAEIQAKMQLAAEAREREEEWNKQKGGTNPEQIRKTGSIFSNEQRDTHALQAIQLVKLAMNPEIPQETILDGFRAMQATYPVLSGENNPWAKCGMELKRFWERREQGLEARL